MATSLIVFVVVFALIISEKMNRTAAAMLGAAVVLLLRAMPYEAALERIDLDVVFLLVGMMIVVDILSQTGLFEWVAISIAQAARGNPVVILAGLLAATALLSAFLDNVTTVVLMAPITILITQILELPTTPFLILKALFSNLGGTATLVGDPPNILIGSKANLSFNQFILHLSPVVILCVAVILLGIVLFTRGKLRTTPALRSRIRAAQPAKAILDPARLRRGLAVFVLILVGFMFSHHLQVQPGIIAIAGAFVMVVVTRSDLRSAMEKVEWETVLFLVGLFMMVGALEHNGLFQIAADSMLALTQGHLFGTALVILWGSALLSACFGNIPVVIALIPLVHTVIQETGSELHLLESPELLATQLAQPLWWSLALGTCLGGNGTLFGAAANIVVTQMAHRNGYPVSFRDFLYYGVPVTLVTLLISTVYVYVRYFSALAVPAQP